MAPVQYVIPMLRGPDDPGVLPLDTALDQPELRNFVNLLVPLHGHLQATRIGPEGLSDLDRSLSG